MTTTEDVLYKENLQGKKYMMPVSPYFYTSEFTASSLRIRLFCCQDLADVTRPATVEQELVLLQRVTLVRSVAASSGYHARLCPDPYVCVPPLEPFLLLRVAVTDTTETDLCPGNDYGESSYICDTVPEQIVPGAEKYTVDYPHSALRALLPSFIAAFKSGKSTVQPPQHNTAVAWYRTTPGSAGSDGGESDESLYLFAMGICSTSSRYPMGPWWLWVGLERSPRRRLRRGLDQGIVPTHLINWRALLDFPDWHKHVCFVLRGAVRLDVDRARKDFS